MKGKITSFITASLITVIILTTLTVISTRSFLPDSQTDKEDYNIARLKILSQKEITNFLGTLLDFNRELFPDFLVDYAGYNVKKTAQVSKTALDLCLSALKSAVSAA